MLVGRPSRNGGGVKWRRAQGDTWAALQGCPCPSETIHGCNAARAIGLAVPEAAGILHASRVPGPHQCARGNGGLHRVQGQEAAHVEGKGAASVRRRSARVLHISHRSLDEPAFDFRSVIQQHAEPNTLPSWKSTFCKSTRTRRALRHPSISRQTYHRDKVGPPNPQANQESCVSFPFRAEITRPELPDPPP